MRKRVWQRLIEGEIRSRVSECERERVIVSVREGENEGEGANEGDR